MKRCNDTVSGQHHSCVNIVSVIVHVKRTRICLNRRFSETNMNVRRILDAKWMFHLAGKPTHLN